MEYQQNLSNLPIPVIVMVAPRIRVQELLPLLPRIVDILNRGVRQWFYRVEE